MGLRSSDRKLGAAWQPFSLVFQLRDETAPFVVTHPTR